VTTSTYRIVVEAEFDDLTMAAFDDLSVERAEGVTVLETRQIDQAALDGVLDRLRLIGARLVELRRMDHAVQ
jgi:hypothetical protein